MGTHFGSHSHIQTHTFPSTPDKLILKLVFILHKFCLLLCISFMLYPEYMRCINFTIQKIVKTNTNVVYSYVVSVSCSSIFYRYIAFTCFFFCFTLKATCTFHLLCESFPDSGTLNKQLDYVWESNVLFFSSSFFLFFFLLFPFVRPSCFVLQLHVVSLTSIVVFVYSSCIVTCLGFIFLL